ncbi:MAG: Demethylmenaquinone methyltransferase protein [Nitrosopumilales archaeon]|nr:MAG: Demethylmenaquinone methyltransferase protein [Nitrosopumilales archaeon]
MNVKEIAISEKEIHKHFSKIASKYRSLRTTDLEPILHIKNKLNGKSGISIADVGCGDGRYSLELLRCLGDNCYIHCIDSNENMLEHLKDYLTEQNAMNFCVKPGDANKLPLENDSMDCIVTFNAIHHFDIQKFLGEVLRSLKDDGSLFIYTRLKNQNSRSIWGKHFPLFTKMENRLYEFDELKSHIREADMKIYSTKVFGYHRTSSLERLVEQARNKHYSTFEFYDGTFGNHLDEFRKNILKNYEDMDNVTWQDENILLEIRK